MRLRIIQHLVNRLRKGSGTRVPALVLAAPILFAGACGDNAFSPEGHGRAGRDPVALPDTVPLEELADDLVAAMPGAGSGTYVAPEAPEAGAFVSGLEAAAAGRVQEADTALAPYGYDVLAVVEESTGDSLVVTLERTPIQRGWGSFVVRRDPESPADLHALHPLLEEGTGGMAVQAYLECGCRWLVLAGAHAAAAADGSSDMALARGSVIQALFESAAEAAPVTISLRGFDPAGRGPPVEASDVVLSLGGDSEGDLAATERARELRELLRDRGLVVGLAGDDPGFSELAGSQSAQGRFANDRFGHGRWIQVQTALPLRLSASGPAAVADALARWVGSF